MSAASWTMESMDIAGVGRAPGVEFTIADGRRVITGEAPGGSIIITALSEGAERSRIQLFNTLTGEMFADIESKMTSAPSLGEDWNSPAQQACELAATLYWSMWRMQQIKAKKSEAAE